MEPLRGSGGLVMFMFYYWWNTSGVLLLVEPLRGLDGNGVFCSIIGGTPPVFC